MNNLQERLKSLSPQQREALLARLRQQNLQQNQKGGVQTIPIRTASSKEISSTVVCAAAVMVFGRDGKWFGLQHADLFAGERQVGCAHLASGVE
jgi:hypothetical protein